MSFNFIPPLLHLASVKIASHFLQDSNIQKLLERDLANPYNFNCFSDYRHRVWKQIEMIEVKKWTGLPTSIMAILAESIRAMHMEAYSWLGDHDLLPCSKGFCFNYRKLIVWRMDGTVDGEKTAKKYVQNERIDCRDRFIMACNYYFEEEILDLWGIVRIVGLNCTYRRGMNAAVRLWVNYLTDGTRQINEMMEENLKVECLREEDIPLNLVPYFQFFSLKVRRDYYDILRHSVAVQRNNLRLCLPQMEVTEREKLIQSAPKQVLLRYLEWPFHFLFIKMANDLASCLNTADFKFVLDGIIRFYILYGYDYFGLFRDFWSIIPPSQKSEIKEDEKVYTAFHLILNYGKSDKSQTSLKNIAKQFFA